MLRGKAFRRQRREEAERAAIAKARFEEALLRAEAEDRAMRAWRREWRETWLLIGVHHLLG